MENKTVYSCDKSQLREVGTGGKIRNVTRTSTERYNMFWKDRAGGGGKVGALPYTSKYTCFFHFRRKVTDLCVFA